MHEHHVTRLQSATASALIIANIAHSTPTITTITATTATAPAATASDRTFVSSLVFGLKLDIACKERTKFATRVLATQDGNEGWVCLARFD